MALKDKLKKVKLVIFDVDGVLTDGSINVDQNGQEFKVFDVQDGLGIVLLHRFGIKTAIISARPSKAVTHRAKDLGIKHVYLNASPKMTAYKKLIAQLKLKDENICFIGDDLMDLAILSKVGVAVSVPNAVSEVKKIVDVITKKSGGRGAVREAIEMILNAQGKWSGLIKELSA